MEREGRGRGLMSEFLLVREKEKKKKDVVDRMVRMTGRIASGNGLICVAVEKFDKWLPPDVQPMVHNSDSYIDALCVGPSFASLEALKRLAGKVSLCGVHANKCMHSATCSKSGGIPVVVTVYQVWSKRRELFRFFWRHLAIAVAYNVNRTHSNLSLTILMTSFF